MLRYTVHTCPDDLSQLQQRLEALADTGAHIVSVVWRQQRVVEQDQSAAFEAGGSFVIICEDAATAVLGEPDIVFDDTALGSGAQT